MSAIKSYLAIAALGLLALGACNNNLTTTASSPSAKPASTPEAKTSEPTAAKSDGKTTDKHGMGGQIVEMGDYHLEFLTAQEADGTHLDLFLQKGANHTPVENANVTAQLQLPDGTQKSVELPYKSDGQHYGTLLSNPKPGDYQVAIQSTIDGEPIKGRFSFTVK